jgi:hypothetical protein
MSALKKIAVRLDVKPHRFEIPEGYKVTRLKTKYQRAFPLRTFLSDYKKISVE